MSSKFDYSELLSVITLFCVSSATLYRGDKCTLTDDSDGICKLITECSTTQELLQAGIYPTICAFDKSETIVCCKDGDETKSNATATTEIIDRTPNITNATVTTEIVGRTPGDISKQKCKEYAQYAYEDIESPTLLLKPHVSKIFECDLQKDKLVLGGSVASRREFPHMALIGYKDEDVIEWYCGGSLISENFVLTAAQCFHTPNTRIKSTAEFVRLGLTNKTHFDHVQERTVSEIIPHPEYNKSSKYHDIGLLRLSKNVDFNTYVRPACLQMKRNVPQDKAIATGWGKIEFTSEASSDVLLKIVLELVSADVCNASYARVIFSRNGELKNGIVDDLMICAEVTTNIRGTCQGDGGGPLQVYHEETEDVKCMYDIIGVISFGRPCGLKKKNIDVHTRVSNYIKWIEDIVWPN